MRISTIAAVVLALAACERSSASGPKIDRAAFLRKCGVGSTDTQCRVAFGKPTRTSGESSGATTWYYERLTMDPATGKADRSAQVVFNARRFVDRVSFE